MFQKDQRSGGDITLERVVASWSPLAASWLLMSVELPAISAIIARLSEPAIHLAAYGAIVFPIALIIEAPIINLLAASTALSKDLDSYLRLRRYMMLGGAGLTVLHVLVAFTPLYYVVVEQILNAPVEIVEPARLGLMIMTPWTWSIAYRRFNQGVLIRFGYSKAVSVGTALRLIADGLVLALGFWFQTIPGIIVATSAVAVGVITEALYIGVKVAPVVSRKVRNAPKANGILTFSDFSSFYTPLALTSLLLLSVQPIGSAALSRMPSALDSLAVWPVVSGLMFMLRCPGHAFQEVVVALSDTAGSGRPLYRFARILTFLMIALLLLISATPLSRFWFEDISGLTPALTTIARNGLWFGLLLPGLAVFQNLYQGVLVHGRHTRAITESVIIFLVTCGAILWVGVRWLDVTGLYMGTSAFSVGGLFQVGWLRWRSYKMMELEG
jgi:hypothetical protein